MTFMPSTCEALLYGGVDYSASGLAPGDTFIYEPAVRRPAPPRAIPLTSAQLLPMTGNRSGIHDFPLMLSTAVAAKLAGNATTG